MNDKSVTGDCDAQLLLRDSGQRSSSEIAFESAHGPAANWIHLFTRIIRVAPFAMPNYVFGSRRTIGTGSDMIG